MSPGGAESTYGTGEAVIPLLDCGVTAQVETGDCVVARGATVDAADRPQDVTAIYSELLKEELVLEDERA